MLDDLGGKAGETACFRLEFRVEVLHLDALIADALPHARQAQAAFLCRKAPGLLRDDGVDHHNIHDARGEDDHALVHADHVRCHAHTALTVRSQRVPEILDQRRILRRSGDGLLFQEFHWISLWIPFCFFYLNFISILDIEY